MIAHLVGENTAAWYSHILCGVQFFMSADFILIHHSYRLLTHATQWLSIIPYEKMRFLAFFIKCSVHPENFLFLSVLVVKGCIW